MIKEVGIAGVFGDESQFGFKLYWNNKKGEFGEIAFLQSATIVIDSETMSKKFVKKVLCKMVDDAAVVC
jgi:hypothetical protein